MKVTWKYQGDSPCPKLVREVISLKSHLIADAPDTALHQITSINLLKAKTIVEMDALRVF